MCPAISKCWWQSHSCLLWQHPYFIGCPWANPTDPSLVSGRDVTCPWQGKPTDIRRSYEHKCEQMEMYFCVLNYSKFTGTGYARCSQPDYRCQPERYEKLCWSQQEMEQLNTRTAGSSHCPLSCEHARDDGPLVSVTILAFHKTPGKGSLDLLLGSTMRSLADIPQPTTCPRSPCLVHGTQPRAQISPSCREKFWEQSRQNFVLPPWGCSRLAMHLASSSPEGRSPPRGKPRPAPSACWGSSRGQSLMIKAGRAPSTELWQLISYHWTLARYIPVFLQSKHFHTSPSHHKY